MQNPKWDRDEIILALNLYFDKERGPIVAKNPKIIALSQVLNKLPIFTNRPNEEKFRNPNGVTLKLSNFLAIDPEYLGKGMGSYSKLDEKIFYEFKDDIEGLKAIASNITFAINSVENESAVALSEEDNEINVGREGQVLLKLHRFRERDKRLVKKKKETVLKMSGKLSCEACNFDFKEVYGNLGDGFIECHHLIPLASYKMSKETQLADLAILCSNCHRMIHKTENISNIEEFKKLILRFS